MSTSVKISPSIMSADLANLARDLHAVRNADYIHIDVIDGQFAPNLTYGVPVVAACKRATDVPLDVHLMINNPDEHADWFVDAGADLVTVHVEAARHLHRLIAHLHDRGVKAGVVLNPATPVCMVEHVIEDVDVVMLMSVNPGFGGQSFIEGTYAKLRQLTEMCRAHGASPLIELDGGVGASNAAAVARAGADFLVAGSAVFGAEDPYSAVDELRSLADAALSGDGE